MSRQLYSNNQKFPSKQEPKHHSYVRILSYKNITAVIKIHNKYYSCNQNSEQILSVLNFEKHDGGSEIFLEQLTINYYIRILLT